MRNFIIGALIVSVLLALFLSPFASKSPDGLEKVAEDKKFLSGGEGQEKWKAPLPDYTLPGVKHEGLSTSVAGVIGTIITFLLVIIAGFLLKKRGKKQNEESNNSVK
ncbi:MAG: PDGLE domain-containing protein [Candidatus Eremiobacterota bacterium]